MKTGSNIEEWSQIYRDALKERFDRREIDSILDMVCEAYAGYSRIDIILQRDNRIPDASNVKIGEALLRLQEGEPVQYILGKILFYGIPLEVNQSVLIPRPETEELVKWVLDETVGKEVELLDLCTGSGCIAIALKNILKDSSVYGLDNSVEALNVATENARSNGIGVDFFHFDLLKQESLAFMSFDVMVSNPPYVRDGESEEMESHVLDYEPHQALFVRDDDPLIFYRRIVDLAEGHLKKGGRIYFEINEAYGSEISQLLRDRGFVDVELRKDLNSRDRMVRGVRA